MRPQSFTLCRNTCKHSTSNQAKWARPPNNQVSRVTQWTRRRWRTPCLTDKTQRDHRNEAVTRAWKRRSRCRREARQLTRRGRLAKKAAVARPHSWSTILSSWSSEIPKGKPKYLEVGTNGYAAKQPGSKESERPSTQDLEIYIYIFIYLKTTRRKGKKIQPVLKLKTQQIFELLYIWNFDEFRRTCRFSTKCHYLCLSKIKLPSDDSQIFADQNQHKNEGSVGGQAA